ncbi:MAG: NDP-sugar synthase [Actinomycetota bacterium]|nr:NDP-sugar synthase [Actinomycetota bacterium]
MPIAAVLFAAGRGERLRPLTDEIAKPALPVLDVPLAVFGLRRLLAIAPAVVMNVRHLPRSVTAAVAPYVPRKAGFETLYETPAAYGTAGTLAALRDRISGRVVTHNADVLTDLDPAALRDFHTAAGCLATVAVREVNEGADFELRGDRAVRFVDRRRSVGGPGGVFIGVAVFEREALDLLPEARPAGLGETLLASLAARGDLAVYRHEGYARDVGSPRDYLEGSLDLLWGRGPRPPDGSWPGEVIEVPGGRAYVGVGAVYPRDGLGPGGILLAGSTVAEGARVERAIVWPGETVPSGVTVSDSIWCRGAIPARGVRPLSMDTGRPATEGPDDEPPQDRS